jgi:hypothetical protein
MRRPYSRSRNPAPVFLHIAVTLRTVLKAEVSERSPRVSDLRNTAPLSKIPFGCTSAGPIPWIPKCRRTSRRSSPHALPALIWQEEIYRCHGLDIGAERKAVWLRRSLHEESARLRYLPGCLGPEQVAGGPLVARRRPEGTSALRRNFGSPAEALRIPSIRSTAP